VMYLGPTNKPFHKAECLCDKLAVAKRAYAEWQLAVSTREAAEVKEKSRTVFLRDGSTDILDSR